MDGVLFVSARHRTGDDRFEWEAEAAEELGIPTAFAPIEPIVNGEPERALENLPRGARRWLYRGWMLNEAEYTGLYEALMARGHLLITPPPAFAEATYLPQWWPLVRGHTPDAIWTDAPDIDAAWTAARLFGCAPLLLKDHVKSAKEWWHRACFIPPHCDRDRFEEICEGLLTFRGDRFEGGFVVRAFLDFAPIAFATQARPVYEEHRLIFWEGELVAHAPYYDAPMPPLPVDQFRWIGERIDSPFFVADVARLADGGWTIVEINDGGTSMLPEYLDPRDLYRRIFDV
jgi:hypothetical protein